MPAPHRPGTLPPHGLDANIFGTRQATLAVLEELCRRYPRPRVLDVGCGDGRYLAALAPRIAEGLGVDVEPGAIAEAARRVLAHRHVAVRRQAAADLGSGSGRTFDLVLFIGSLEHMPDPAAALAAARGRMHEDSRLLVVAISPSAPHAIVSRLALSVTAMPVVGHLGVEGVRRLAPRAGLRVERVQTLRRGPAAGRLARLIPLYDWIGGATRAVVLKPAGPAPRRSAGRPAAAPTLKPERASRRARVDHDQRRVRAIA